MPRALGCAHVHVPKKRLLVYAAAGLVVLAVGMIGLLAMRASAGVQTEGMVLDVSGAQAEAQSSAWPAGSAIPAPAVSTTASSPVVTEAALIYVQVAGAVRRPGVYQVPPDARAFQAVMQAGGFTEDADQEAVPLAARLSDGCRLYVPRHGETVVGSALTTDPRRGREWGHGGDRAGLAQFGDPAGAGFASRDRSGARSTDRVLSGDSGSFHVDRPAERGARHRSLQARAVAAACRSLTLECPPTTGVAVPLPGSCGARGSPAAPPSRR